MTVSSVIRKYRRHYLLIWLHSIFIALLALVPFLYLLQVHERVYTSRSWETLWFITGAVVFCLIVWGILTFQRGEALSAIGHRMDDELRTEVFDAVHRSGEQDAFRAYGDIATFRRGATGTFVSSLFDASLTPVFIGVLFLLHHVFGWVALAYIVVVTLLSYRSRKIWQRTRKEAKPLEDRAFAFGLSTAAKGETIRAMYLLPGVRRLWAGLQNQASEVYIEGQRQAGSIDAALATLRHAQLVIVLGVGAVLYLQDEITTATAFAAFIIMMRGVSPILTIASNWPVLQETQDAMSRLNELLEKYAPETKTSLPDLQGQVTCEHVGSVTPGGKKILNGIHFTIPKSSILGVIGPSGAGKSTFLKLLAGGQKPSLGSVKIDRFPISQWPPEQLGPSIGYLPQSVDLLPGTIWDNVSRFDIRNEETNAKVLEALRMAGALEMVQQKDVGLDFELAMDGAPLSGGQRQRLGLARAFYGSPKLVIMDEPNSALDADGERVLAYSITELKRAGGTVVFSTHKADLLEICDYILVIMDGYQHSFSTRNDILNRFKVGGNKTVSITGDDDPSDGTEPMALEGSDR